MVILTALPLSVFANIDFYDINEVPWAKESIQKMVQEKVVSGYVEDGTLRLVFKPKDLVTKVQAIQMVYNTLKATNKLQSADGLYNKYILNMQSNGIPNWAYDAVAYALEYGIITVNDLPSMIINSTQVPAKREEVAIYVGKALNFDQIILNPQLRFIDAEIIDRNAKSYVELLVNQGILSGDNNNMFNPKNPITRAEMAAVCTRALNYIRQNNTSTPVPPVTPTPPVNNNTNVIKERDIDFIATDTRTLIVKDENNQLDVYRLATSVIIEIDGVKRDIDYLSKGQKIQMVFDSSNQLIKITDNTKDSDFEGTIVNSYLDQNYINIIVRDKEDSSNRRIFQVLKNMEVKATGGFITADRLEKDNFVKVKTDNNNVTSIEVILKEQRVDGILESTIAFSETPIIKVRVDNNRIVELKVDPRVDVYKNNRYRDLIDLVKGDIVQLEVEDSKVVSIDAFSSKTEDTGVVKSIVIGRPTKLLILNENQKEVEYTVTDNVDIYIDDVRSTLFDLRVDYKVELELESSTIIAIEAEKIEPTNTKVGEITRIYSGYNVVVIKYINVETGKNESLSITVTDDTRIISETGSTTTLSRLYEKDKIFVDGYSEDDLFIAKRIIVLDN